jgi:hypothetical protein
MKLGGGVRGGRECMFVFGVLAWIGGHSHAWGYVLRVDEASPKYQSLQLEFEPRWMRTSAKPTSPVRHSLL